MERGGLFVLGLLAEVQRLSWVLKDLIARRVHLHRILMYGHLFMMWTQFEIKLFLPHSEVVFFLPLKILLFFYLLLVFKQVPKKFCFFRPLVRHQLYFVTKLVLHFIDLALNSIYLKNLLLLVKYSTLQCFA